MTTKEMIFLGTAAIGLDSIHDEQIMRRRALQRVGFYVEPLFEDNTLRDNLHDDDAERLLEWALSYLEAEMVGSSNLSPMDRSAQISYKAGLVCITVCTVNVLMGEMSTPEPPSEKDLRFLLNDLLQNIYSLTGKRTNPFQVKRAIYLAKNYQKMHNDVRFAELFALVENTREIELTTPPNNSGGS